ncbi:glycine zipper 2TM domain-containing protein [Undibacterium umbellatum]|uniref:Glycine zipper 2TM domain-containing protein n=1 Tax=Undibacterium umbellatum TaxID=2762300 RepID=A0ABR6Z5W0_9BURK|nr:glycine zipper 2TM domain-containing protein [Undibacterium umbellatum]MBC3907137.1 glycine zipper 2TM domain-containing protein [Undibacterium umbellatum]
MNIYKKSAIAVSIAASALLTGCGTNSPSMTTAYPASQASYSSYGVIESIQVVQVSSENRGPGAGAVVGGIVGGILGNQVGGGLGNAAATAVGVVGGAIVGNNLEKNNRNQQVREAYQISVRLDNGAYQSIVQDNIVDLRVGNRVYVKDNYVYRN